MKPRILTDPKIKEGLKAFVLNNDMHFHLKYTGKCPYTLVHVLHFIENILIVQNRARVLLNKESYAKYHILSLLDFLRDDPENNFFYDSNYREASLPEPKPPFILFLTPFDNCVGRLMENTITDKAILLTVPRFTDAIVKETLDESFTFTNRYKGWH